MRGTTLKMMAMALAVTVALTGFSCTKEKSPGKEMPKAPPAGPGQAGGDHQKGVAREKKKIVAIVNGTDITADDLMKEMNRIVHRYVGDTKKRTPEIDKRVKQDALNLLIFRELAIEDAIRQGMKASPEAIDEVLKKLKTTLGSEEAYREYLLNSGLTEKSLRTHAGKDVLYAMILDKEIYKKVDKGDKPLNEVVPLFEKKKVEWEKGLRKNARVEILIPLGEQNEKGGASYPH